MGDNSNTLGSILRQQRYMKSMPLQEVASKSGVSASYVNRIENGNRIPSARILHKIAEPLGFEDSELLELAGYLSPESSKDNGEKANNYQAKRLDSYVASVLAREPIETQYAVLPILNALRMIARDMSRDKSKPEEKEDAQRAQIEPVDTEALKETGLSSERMDGGDAY